MKTITLKYPYMGAEGNKIDVLKMRRATVGDLRSLRKTEDTTSAEINLLASLVGLVPEDLDQMDQADYVCLQEVYVEQLKEHNKSRQ